MSVFTDIGLPEPYPIPADDIELLFDGTRLAGFRYGAYEKLDPKLERTVLRSRHRRRLRRGWPLPERLDQSIRRLCATHLGVEVGGMSRHKLLDFLGRAGKL